MWGAFFFLITAFLLSSVSACAYQWKCGRKKDGTHIDFSVDNLLKALIGISTHFPMGMNSYYMRIEALNMKSHPSCQKGSVPLAERGWTEFPCRITFSLIQLNIYYVLLGTYDYPYSRQAVLHMFNVGAELRLNMTQSGIRVDAIKFANRQEPLISLSEVEDILHSPSQYGARCFDLAEYMLNTRKAVCSAPKS
nr:unnamed protein product [Spirometra erinaceieuropaei]